ncbi:hypothetical protein ELQ35_01880 [Peribacillus cavernae]|uniref:Uncharacterized protein n=1 Tax=Peribacillus cavernae TaxID=1674310 RepID=A0A3S0WCH8_9BACI|nr:hypothetical protein [Peribacillus cavernae]MDQ0220688.1 hypothetical protein [Peribacillus cavernae]RUQ32413.1 hypothetical protein ELQ35_01880 [Peribacillus cavernae]
MLEKTVLVSLNDIEAYYIDEIINEDRAKRMIHAFRKSEMIHFVLEQTISGKYILVNGFSAFSAFRKVHPEITVLAYLKPETSEKERLIHILSVTFPLERTSWVFKNEHVMRLIYDHNMEIAEVARMTNQTQNKIKECIADIRIPLHIRQVMVMREARTVVNKICSSTVIPENLKPLFYEYAVLRKGNKYRLSTLDFSYLIDFFNLVSLPSYLKEFNPTSRQFFSKLLANYFYLANHYQQLIINPDRFTLPFRVSVPVTTRNLSKIVE